MSAMKQFASLQEHCHCFPREDVFLVFALGSVWRNTVPRDVFPCTLPRTQGVYWISSNINPVGSEYQEIYSYSALIIDNVKINTSLIMMRECPVFHGSTYTFGKIAHIKVQKKWPFGCRNKNQSPIFNATSPQNVELHVCFVRLPLWGRF